MSGKIRTEIISRKCIKPTSPTPQHLKSFKLSLLDQLSPNIHGNATFFYPSNAATDGSAGAGDPQSRFSTKSQLLQNSLSQTLTRLYPLVGRLRDAATIDCNDDGAFFVEARTDIPLSDLLSQPDFDALEHFLPTTDKETMELSNGSMLLVQFTLFGCGGTAVSISLSHKIADIASVITIFQSWTAACRAGTEPDIPDLGLGASLFPPREIPGMSGSVNIGSEKFTATRLVFSGSKVGQLKNRVATALGKAKTDADTQFHPSRVEVVLALIWRCALSASRSITGSFKPSALFQAVNLRPRMEPPVPGTAIGNFVWPFAVTVEEEKELELEELVKKMRKGMMEFVEKKASKFKEEGGFEAVMDFLKERGEMLKKDKDIVIFKCSSWCRFPLLEVDYGWGSPVWMASVNRIVSNTVALMDVRDGGVEALVTLNEQEMDIFEQHHELLQYAQLNPRIVI